MEPLNKLLDHKFLYISSQLLVNPTVIHREGRVPKASSFTPSCQVWMAGFWIKGCKAVFQPNSIHTYMYMVSVVFTPDSPALLSSTNECKLPCFSQIHEHLFLPRCELKSKVWVGGLLHNPNIILMILNNIMPYKKYKKSVLQPRCILCDFKQLNPNKVP